MIQISEGLSGQQRANAKSVNGLSTVRTMCWGALGPKGSLSIN